MANLDNKKFFLVQAGVFVSVICLLTIIFVLLSKNVKNIKHDDTLTPNQNSSKTKLITPFGKNGNKLEKPRAWPESLPKPPYCGNAGGSNKIVGGRVLEFYEHPWTAILEFSYGGEPQFECGGTLINHQYVLTAAHCLHFTQQKQIVGVWLGEHNLFEEFDCMTTDPADCPNSDNSNECECATDKAVLYGIDKIHIHEQYNNETKQNDIALIKLNATVLFNEITKPICLPDDDFNKHHRSKIAFAIGWGFTISGDNQSESSIKKIVALPIWDQEICMKQIGTTMTQICAGGEEGNDSCTNDSGGPLVALAQVSRAPAWFLEGIVSYGVNGACGLKGYPGVYTNVSAFMDWILMTIDADTL